MNEILLPDGIRIGNADDGVTGVTCILTDKAVGGVSVRGGAPGTRETDMLRADRSQGFVDAIVLSGGSAYGLEASCGVMEFLRERGVGFVVGDKVVPLVAQAILFDLNTPGEYRYPDKIRRRRRGNGCDGGQNIGRASGESRRARRGYRALRRSVCHRSRRSQCAGRRLRSQNR